MCYLNIGYTCEDIRCNLEVIPGKKRYLVIVTQRGDNTGRPIFVAPALLAMDACKTYGIDLSNFTYVEKYPASGDVKETHWDMVTFARTDNILHTPDRTSLSQEDMTKLKARFVSKEI